MFAARELLEKLLEGRTTAVADSGELILGHLSEGRVDVASFLGDPGVLLRPPHSVSRYLAQVTLRALQNDYDSVDEIAGGLQALFERNPPTIEPGRPPSADRVVIPEARVLELTNPVRNSDGGHWESGIVALVTSGEWRGREIDIHLRSDVRRDACLLVPLLWIHATIAVYNIEPANAGRFNAGRDTFIVIEPMRQINVTTVARALHCTKPQLDQIRRGKGDTTIPTLKGTLVHAIFDRLLESNADPKTAYEDLLPKFFVPLASVVDESFDETEFRRDVLRHGEALLRFVDANPHLRHEAQVELRRYSATLGIQGRIDAVFRHDNRMDILELKTGSRLRDEDHAQLFIYRLLLSDFVRRWQKESGRTLEISSRLLSSASGSDSALQVQTDFHQVLHARNQIVATHHALGHSPGGQARYEGFNKDVCGSCISWTRKRCKESSDLFGDRPGAQESSKLAYFRRWTALVERERWATEQDLADLLDDNRIENRVKNFRALADVRIVADAEPFTFVFDRNTSDLQPGDAVLIHSGNISSTSTFHGYIHRMDVQRVVISIPLKNLAVNAFSGKSWIVDRFPSDVTSEASHTALHDFLKMGERGVRPLVPPFPTENRGTWGQTPLSPNQKEAVERASECSEFHLIWGPPGTGKTWVIPEIVRRVGGPVLLGAFTNTAVDKMLMALLDAAPTIRFLRIGRASDSPELATRLADPSEYFSEDLGARCGSVYAVRQAMDAAQIVAATAHRACTMPYLRHRKFEMVLVDEAGQLTEPLTLGLILRGRRYVLVGDDRQLPPVVRTRGLAQSMFERLKLEAEAANSQQLTLLDTQYRMHPEIMSVSNRLFYDGRLKSGVSHDDRLPPDDRSVMLVPVFGNGADSRRNDAEAAVVEQLVRRYLAVAGITPAMIGIVSPFRSQAGLIRKLLHDTAVTVDTVERFQGGERDIMILSLVRAEGSEFVFDERRFNVAITRARRKLIFVAHPKLFQNSRYEWLSTFAEGAG